MIVDGGVTIFFAFGVEVATFVNDSSNVSNKDFLQEFAQAILSESVLVTVSSPVGGDLSVSAQLKVLTILHTAVSSIFCLSVF